MVNVQTEVPIRQPRDVGAECAANPDNAPQGYDNIDSSQRLTTGPIDIGSKVARSAKQRARTCRS